MFRLLSDGTILYDWLRYNYGCKQQNGFAFGLLLLAISLQQVQSDLWEESWK
jgi:hypothetical protein